MHAEHISILQLHLCDNHVYHDLQRAAIQFFKQVQNLRIFRRRGIDDNRIIVFIGDKIRRVRRTSRLRSARRRFGLLRIVLIFTLRHRFRRRRLRLIRPIINLHQQFGEFIGFGILHRINVVLANIRIFGFGKRRRRHVQHGEPLLNQADDFGLVGGDHEGVQPLNRVNARARAGRH